MENFKIQTTVSELERNHQPIQYYRKNEIFKIAQNAIVEDKEVLIIGVNSKILPKSFIANKLNIHIEPKAMDYKQETNDTLWVFNFADPNLVGYHHSCLFAQDEIQVAEHPYMSSCRKLIQDNGYDATTIDENGDGTPILLTNIPRMCSVKITNEIYGKNFEKASIELIKNHIEQFEKATYSNIMAICSLNGFSGFYTPSQIGWLMTNLYGAFYNAKRISNTNIAVQTGFWGCGAFGGNKTLMVAIQVIVAYIANISSITFYTLEDSKNLFAKEGIKIASDLVKKYDGNTIDIINSLVEMKFLWGKSDMN